MNNKQNMSASSNGIRKKTSQTNPNCVLLAGYLWRGRRVI